MVTTKKERAALKARVEALFGGHGAHSKLADGLGVSRTTLLRVYTGDTDRVPDYLEAVLELLEALPADKWPERWQRFE
ncbi:MAG: hypothetical protein ABL901_16010 [Hyphomicrobiaceae bacterium]|nr:hypothetical protein [Hyphomicrobiaceae bacterium]